MHYDSNSSKILEGQEQLNNQTMNSQQLEAQARFL